MNIQAYSRLASAMLEEPRVVVVHGLDGFLAMEAEWNALFARCGQPQQVFQSHRLLSLWAEAYAELSREIVVIAAYCGDDLIAALPLVRRTRFGMTALYFMGVRIAQFDDMLLDPRCDRTTLDTIWAALASLAADYLEARRIRADAAFQCFRDKEHLAFEQMEAPFACLKRHVDGDGPGEAYSAKDRSNFRRRQRRLGERGKLAMTTYPAGTKAGELALEAIAMKRGFLRRMGVLTSAVNAAEFAAFFASAASDPASGLLVSTIEIDDRPVAIDLSFLCKQTGFGHVLATDPEYEREGVGNQLVHHVFASAKAVGATSFDLLAPADSYKIRHADGTTAVESLVYPFNARGRLAALTYKHGLPAARRTLAALRHNRAKTELER